MRSQQLACPDPAGRAVRRVPRAPGRAIAARCLAPGGPGPECKGAKRFAGVVAEFEAFLETLE